MEITGRVKETWVMNVGVAVAVNNSEGSVSIKVEICSSYCVVVKSGSRTASGVENPIESTKPLPQNGVNGNRGGGNDDEEPCTVTALVLMEVNGVVVVSLRNRVKGVVQERDGTSKRSGGFKQNLHKKKTQNTLAIFANRQCKRQMNEKIWSKENKCEGERRIVYLLLRLRWSEDTVRRRATTTTMSTLEDKNVNQRLTTTVVGELKQEEREQDSGVRICGWKYGSGGRAARAFVVGVSEVGWGGGTHFPACLDAGDLFFRKACGGERGGSGWGMPTNL
jgi:hypothetical protein